MSDRCIFCGWNRTTCYKDIKFFALPKEPGLKRLLWMYAVQKKVLKRHDKICSIHFRQGRPSNDPSHEDFIPHLFLNPEKAAPEVLSYLENQDMNGSSNERKSVQNHDSSSLESDDSSNNKKPNILRSKKRGVTPSNAPSPDSSSIKIESSNIKKVRVIRNRVLKGISSLKSTNS